MKRIFLSMVCAALLFTPAQAAPKKFNLKTPKPQTGFFAQPTAVALLDQSIAAYRNLKGLSLRYDSKWINGGDCEEQNGTFDFSHEDKIVKMRRARDDELWMVDGVWFYAKPDPFDIEEETINHKLLSKNYFLERMSTSPSGANKVFVVPDELLWHLLEGANPLRKNVSTVFREIRVTGRRLPDAVIEGVKLQGVQILVHAFDANDDHFYQWTAWFDPQDHLLRRVQFSQGFGHDAAYRVSMNRFLDIKINPEFSPETFKIPVALPKEKAPKEKS